MPRSRKHTGEDARTYLRRRGPSDNAPP